MGNIVDSSLGAVYFPLRLSGWEGVHGDGTGHDRVGSGGGQWNISNGWELMVLE